MDKGVLKCKNLGKSIAKTPTKIGIVQNREKSIKIPFFYK